jgi:hypothetical protein
VSSVRGHGEFCTHPDHSACPSQRNKNCSSEMSADMAPPVLEQDPAPTKKEPESLGEGTYRDAQRGKDTPKVHNLTSDFQN